MVTISIKLVKYQHPFRIQLMECYSANLLSFRIIFLQFHLYLVFMESGLVSTTDSLDMNLNIFSVFVKGILKKLRFNCF
jgi:hypothetical protein